MKRVTLSLSSGDLPHALQHPEIKIGFDAGEGGNFGGEGFVIEQLETFLLIPLYLLQLFVAVFKLFSTSACQRVC